MKAQSLPSISAANFAKITSLGNWGGVENLMRMISYRIRQPLTVVGPCGEVLSTKERKLPFITHPASPRTISSCPEDSCNEAEDRNVFCPTALSKSLLVCRHLVRSEMTEVVDQHDSLVSL